MNDRYSKLMLTIIAFALLVNTFQQLNVVNPAYAASGVTKIAICTADGSECARVSRAGLFVNP
jgi:hypothetical protein